MNGWTRRSAFTFVKALWEPLKEAGWHVALTGSVLYRGSSDKDLDLIAFPRRRGVDAPDADSIQRLREVFKASGLTCFRTVEQVRADWLTRGTTDRKHVEVWHDTRERRIGVFVMS